MPNLKSLLNGAIRLIALGALCVAPIASGDPKPPPPFEREPSGPPAPDVGGFKNAYERAKEPNMLVICGLDVPRDKGVGPVATGRPQDSNFIGANVSLFDTTGDSGILKNEMEEYLRQGGVDVVNIDALSDADRRETALLQLRDARGAVELLAHKVNADIVIVVRMLGTEDVHQAGVPYRVSAEMLNVTRGRKIGGVAGFDWRGNTDARSIKFYAGQITRKLFDDFIQAYPAANRGDLSPAKYTLRLVGVSDVKTLNKAVKAFKEIDGVTRCRAPSMMSLGGKNAVATIDLTYTGESLALMGDLQDAAEKELGFKVEGVDGNFSTFTLIASPPVKDESEQWQTLMDSERPGHRELADDVVKYYKLKGSPKIGIFVNREPTDQEKQNDQRLGREYAQAATTRPSAPESSNPGQSGVMVVLNLAQEGSNIVQGKNNKTGGGGGVDPAIVIAAASTGAEKPQALQDTRSMEDALFKKFNSLGFQTVDPNIARDRLREQADKARVLYRDSELPFLLGRAAGVDTVILGIGRLDRAQGRFDYTFRVVRVTDGTVLAAETLAADTFPSASFEGQILDRATDYITGNLALQMRSRWMPPNTISVSVQNVKDLHDLDVIRKFFTDNVKGVVRADFIDQDAGISGGRAEFRIEYEKTPEELNQTLDALASEGKLPFDLDTDRRTRDTIALKLRDRH